MVTVTRDITHLLTSTLPVIVKYSPPYLNILCRIKQSKPEESLADEVKDEFRLVSWKKRYSNYTIKRTCKRKTSSLQKVQLSKLYNQDTGQACTPSQRWTCTSTLSIKNQWRYRKFRGFFHLVQVKVLTDLTKFLTPHKIVGTFIYSTLLATV